MYQPKTGAPCACKRGIQRDNCPSCEGTGYCIDFRAIRAQAAQSIKVAALLEALRFYADQENWKEVETGIGMYPGEAVDYGARARQALNAVEGADTNRV